MAQVYRLFDKEQNLLYVGCSLNYAKRLPNHTSKPWFNDVVSVTMQHYPELLEAVEAEKYAIQTEFPLHNKHRYNRGRKPVLNRKKGKFPGKDISFVLHNDLINWFRKLSKSEHRKTSQSMGRILTILKELHKRDKPEDLADHLEKLLKLNP